MALSISNCGDFYLERSKGFLPTTCDDAFYRSPGKKQVLDTTDHDIEAYFDSREDSSFSGPEKTTRSLLSTTIPRLRTLRYMQNPEARQQSFQLLLRMHTNNFNQRLSMLESNTLDMKDSLENIRKQNSHFSSQLKTLTSVLSRNDKKDRINEFANKYTDIKTRLSKLEHKLEILIDGFTDLAQELDKVKRARHEARPPQDRKKNAVVATTPIPALTTAGTTRMSTSRFKRRTVIPKTLPTPLAPISTTSFVSGRSQKDESSTKRQAKVSTKRIQPISTRRDIETNFTSKTDNKYHSKSSRSSTVPKGIVSRPLTTSSERTLTMVTSNETQQNQQKRKAPTEVSVTPQKAHKSGPKVNRKSQKATRKHDQLSRSPTKPQGKEESATKFQIPPPSHTNIAANSSKSSSKPQKVAHIPSKNSSKSMKTQRNDLKVRTFKEDTNINKPSHNVQTMRRHSKTKSSKQNIVVPSHEARGASDFMSSQPEKFTYTTASSKSTDKKRLHPSKPKVQITTPRKSTRSNTFKTINILDILMKSNRGQKTLTRSMLKQNKNLHIVLGRLAIPIKIIPDY